MHRRLPFIIAACLIAGCSGKGPPLAEVTGEVTFNGLPAMAEIIFEPDAGKGQAGGRPSSALTQSDGSFRLQYTADRTGAVLGLHRVLVKILPVTNDGEPQSFQDAVTPVKIARLKRQVRTGKNHFRFAVTL